MVPVVPVHAPLRAGRLCRNSHCGQQVSLFGRDPEALALLVDTRAVRARLESLFGAGISVEVALDSRLGEEPSGKTDARVRLSFLPLDLLTRLTHACDHGSAIMLMGWSAAPA